MFRLKQTQKTNLVASGSKRLKDLVPARPALRFKARRRRSRVTVQVVSF